MLCTNGARQALDLRTISIRQMLDILAAVTVTVFVLWEWSR